MSDQNDQLHAMRHSLAHIMATAVTTIWPQAKLGVGPVVENGFYYDIDLGDIKVSEDDFEKIEAEMRNVIAADQAFERSEKGIDDAIAWAQTAAQPYKEELLNDLKRAGTTVAKDLDTDELGLATEGDGQVAAVSFYKNGSFEDLCRGPHVESTGKVGAFKLMRVAGAYWRGKETNAQMQRLYGVAFATDKELRQYLNMLEEAKKRDHRKLGQELDLFIVSDLIGGGLPLFTPRGTVIRDAIGAFSQELQAAHGYERVTIPHMAKADLYKVSGHYDKYPERFSVTSIESDDEFMMKPMSCPHHVQLYSARPRSYRDLPIRYMENTQVYRDEKSGELHGLSRVRMITQDDSHAFCTPSQVGSELSAIIEMVRDMYTTFDMPYRATLSFRNDSDKYLGDADTWAKAQSALKDTMDFNGIEYEIFEGEAAFYGPKVDFMVKDAIGREWQLATLQLDFLQPDRFELEFINEAGDRERPVMIHKALLGSIERFMSVYIEHTAGRFPIWVAPEQVRLITVNQEESTVNFADSVVQRGRELGLRITVDNSHESVGKKIRNAEVWKVPYTLVIGEKEIASSQVTPRVRKDLVVIDAHPELGVDDFLKTVQNETKSRVNKTSL